MRRTILVVLCLAIAVMAADCSDDDDEFDEGEATEDTLAEETLVEDESDVTVPVGDEDEADEEAADEDAAREPEATITGVDSGTFDGESWIRLDLAAALAPGGERLRYGVEFTTDEGDSIVAAYNLEPTGDPFTTSFCIGETPSCPDGIFPIVAVPKVDDDGLVFTFAIDAFANSTNPTFRAFVEVGPADDPDARAAFPFQGGEQSPLLTEERDPC